MHTASLWSEMNCHTKRVSRDNLEKYDADGMQKALHARLRSLELNPSIFLKTKTALGTSAVVFSKRYRERS